VVHCHCLRLRNSDLRNLDQNFVDVAKYYYFLKQPSQRIMKDFFGEVEIGQEVSIVCGV